MNIHQIEIIVEKLYVSTTSLLSTKPLIIETGDTELSCKEMGGLARKRVETVRILSMLNLSFFHPKVSIWQPQLDFQIQLSSTTED